MSGIGLAALLSAACVAAGGQSLPCVESRGGSAASRVTGDWRASSPVRASVPALPNRQGAGLTAGVESGSAWLERMILLLEPSAEQKAALDQELIAQQTPGSSHFHKWLTAAEFADRFAVSAEDAVEVTAWLRTQGFEVAPLPAGRGWIEFLGTAAQVEQAFHATVHIYDGESGRRYVLSGAIAVPEALAPVIHGLVSLDGIQAEAALAVSGDGAATTPTQMSAKLHLDALHAAGTTGAGETIAIVSRSGVDAESVAAFRTRFGLRTSEVMVAPEGAAIGADADRAATELVAEWAGATAPGARIEVVSSSSTEATDGIDLALAEIVDGALAHTVVVGYSACEAEMSEAHRALYASLYRQAAAEGISIVGSSGCRVAGETNALASTPWNTAIGALAPTDATYQDATHAIGGASTIYLRPAWQAGLTQKVAGRLTPDLALPASADATSAAIFGGISALLAQKYGAQGNLDPRLYELSRQGGIFENRADAGSGFDPATGLGSVNAEALVKAWPQATGTGATSIVLTFSPNQVNDTYNPSAAITFTAAVASGTGGAMPTGTVAFTDSTNGTTLAGSPVNLNASGQALLTVSSGLAIGGNNVVASYSGDDAYAAKSSAPVVVTLQKSTTTLTVTPPSSTPAAGASITVQVTLMVGSPAEGSAAPSGLVTLNLDGKAAGGASLANNSASYTVTILSTGQHQLQAVYAGDANYSASTSDAVTLTVAKAATVITLTASPTTLTPGIPEAFTAVLAPAAGSTGNDNITGTVSFYDGATLLGSAYVKSYAATLSSITLDTSKSHLITAVYSGDTNWAAVTSKPLSLTAALLADTVTLAAVPTAAGPGQAVALTVTVVPTTTPDAAYEQNPTGKVTFYNVVTAIGTATLAASLGNSSTATLTTATLPPGSNTITAIYAGDSYYAIGTSNVVTVTVEDFSIVGAPGNPPSGLTIVKGESGTASFLVSGLGGYNNQIQVTCNVPQQDYMTCTPSPVQVTPTGTVTFTVQTFKTGSPATTVSQRGDNPLLRVAGGVGLAVVLFIAPMGRRSRRLRRWMALVVLAVGLAGAGLGCGSSSGNPTADSGTPLGTATLTITATAYVNQAVVSHSVYLQVNVVPGQ